MLQEHGRGPQRLLSVGLRADGKEEEAGDFADGLKGKREAQARPSRRTS